MFSALLISLMLCLCHFLFLNHLSCPREDYGQTPHLALCSIDQYLHVQSSHLVHSGIEWDKTCVFWN